MENVAVGGLSEIVKNHIKGIEEQVNRCIDKTVKKENRKLNLELRNASNAKLSVEECTKTLVVNSMQKIEFDIGGTIYCTSLNMLLNSKSSIFHVLFDSDNANQLKRDKNGRYFIDRNGKYFGYILDQLRDGFVLLPLDDNERRRITMEASFFGVSLHERTPIVSKWELDTSLKNASLVLSNKNMTVMHIGGAAHASVAGNKILNNDVFRWDIRIDGPAHWVGIGIAEKSKMMSNGLTNDYNHFWGASSANQLYKMTGPLAAWTTGMVLSCKFDAKKKQFTIIGPGTNLSASNIAANDIVPVINLFTHGNKATLVKIY